MRDNWRFERNTEWLCGNSNNPTMDLWCSFQLSQLSALSYRKRIVLCSASAWWKERNENVFIFPHFTLPVSVLVASRRWIRSEMWHELPGVWRWNAVNDVEPFHFVYVEFTARLKHEWGSTVVRRVYRRSRCFTIPMNASVMRSAESVTIDSRTERVFPTHTSALPSHGAPSDSFLPIVHAGKQT